MIQTHKVVERPLHFIGVKGYAAEETIHFLGSEAECTGVLRELEGQRRVELEHASDDAPPKLPRTIFLVKPAWPTDRITVRSDE